MKITQVVSNFPPYYGGIGNACMCFSRELLRQGNEVKVYTSNYPDIKYKYPDGLEVHRLRHQARYRHATLMLGLFKIKGADIIQLHLPFYFGGEIVYILSRIRGIKYTVTYHTDLVGVGMLKVIFALHRRLILGPILRRSEKIYVTSHDYAEHSNLMGISGIKDKIVEIPLGINLNHFTTNNNGVSIRNKLDIPESSPIVLFVGALDRPHYSKGLNQLLLAFNEVNTLGHLVIIGDGELKSQYHNKAINLGIENKVHFTGRVSDTDLPKYYSASDIFVLPSTDKTEAFGMVTLEAMASGKAAIVSNLPGVRTLIEVGQSGLLVEPGDIKELTDALRRLLLNKELRDKFGLRGRIIAKTKYDWQVIGNRLNISLEQLVTDKKNSQNGFSQSKHEI
jgi:rhamnosyl/mannosyltransferase